MTRNDIIFDTNASVADHIDGRTIDLLITDPPFGVDVSINFAITPEGKSRNEKIDNDSSVELALATFDTMLETASPYFAEHMDVYVFTSWQVLGEWERYARTLEARYGLVLKGIGVWVKGWPGLGDLKGSWGMGHEFILYLKRGCRPVHHRRTFVLSVDRLPSGQNIHPTEKPVALIESLIEMSSDEGDLVYDPFSGSGSTSLAAQKLGRDSLAFETDERFIDPSRGRLANVGLFGV